jgi:hypothetical protein
LGNRKVAPEYEGTESGKHATPPARKHTQKMKSSTISNPFALSGNADAAALTERIMPAPIYRGTYNSIVSAVLSVMTIDALVIIDTEKRTVSVGAGNLDVSGAVAAAAGGISQAIFRRFEPTDENERTAGILVKNAGGDVVTSGVVVPSGQTALDAAFDLSLGAQDTSKSLGALADSIADAVLSQDKHAIIIIDQLGNQCTAWVVGSTSTFTAKTVMDGEVEDSTIAVFNVAVPEVTAPVGFFGV